MITPGTFIERVRRVLDMDNISELITTDDTDAATLDAIIESNIVPACKEIVSIAPARMLTPGSSVTSGTKQEFVKSNGMYVYKSTLPADFYRPLFIKMKSWQRPATIIYDDDPLYALQSSEWAGLRGNPETPIAAFVKTNGGCGYRMELYTCETETDVCEELGYVPIPSTTTNKVNIPSRVEDACIYACASLTAETFGNANLAERLMAHAYRLAEITINTSENNGN